MCAFDLDQERRPWMIYNCRRFELSENFADFADLGGNNS